MISGFLVLSLVMVSYRAASAADTSEITKPGCQDECGGVKIPFPFGIGDGCHPFNYTFTVICDNSSGTPVPRLAKSNRTILSISIEDSSLRVFSEVAYQCYNDGLAISSSSHSSPKMDDMWGFYNISTTKNLLVGIGCDTIATYYDSFTGVTNGCVTSCSSFEPPKSGSCSGVHGCCATPIFNADFEAPAFRAQSMTNYTGLLNGGGNNCSVAFVTEAVNGSYDFSFQTLTASPAEYARMRVPVVFHWRVASDHENCSESMKLTKGYGAYVCGDNTRCLDLDTYHYRCKCSEGYTGNPYLPHGCQDINECVDERLNQCKRPGYCVNKGGGYECRCPEGYHGGGTLTSPCIAAPGPIKLIFGISVSMGSIIAFVIFYGLYKLFKRRKEIRARRHNFKKNGGLLLRQEMSTNEGAIDRTKIFSRSDLEKATDYFNDNRVLGRGGQGTVYKGMLTDGTIVAVKKSKKVDENQLGQFINEVVILSQINHRNIVKLFGCCLETVIFYGLYKLFKRRKEIRARRHNFKKNGGLLLRQEMSTNEGAIDRTKIFSRSDLEKATDYFNDNRVLGRGGQGTVYKGMLTDGTIVAVKKSKKVDENQLGQFINEVVILSQINHRNIVKLFGCCLETEVPLLVYEFVPNGTLYQHIHHPSEDLPMTWKIRFQIAIECARAVSYLHSSCSSPIHHRDIKSSNILLDEKYKAKVSDFGTSRSVSIDKTHVTTCVQGTFGYLDPEFFRSSQFNDKSDVYSFGVVLLELLTSMKPIFTSTFGEPRGLATEFIQIMETSPDQLNNILDTQVLQNCSKEEIETLTKLVEGCLSMNAKQRPTMSEVAMTLEMIKKQHDEEDNPATEQGGRRLRQGDGSLRMDEMSLPCSNSSTSAITDNSYSMEVEP